MIKHLLRMGIKKFSARYSYDASYMSHVVEHSTSAGLRLLALPLYGQFRGPEKALGIWAGAVVASTMEGDCGPCVQLVVDMALEAGVPAGQIELCLQGRAAEAGQMGLGFRFAQAAIADLPELEALRHEIEEGFGPEAVIAASFAASSGRVYPVLKRGLGYGHTCSRVSIENRMIEVAHQT